MTKKIFKILSLGIALLLFCSCGNFSYYNIYPAVKINKNTLDSVSITQSRDFFMWGFYPSVHKIDVKSVLDDHGVNEYNGLAIKEQNSWKTIGWSILTFGMYSPRKFQIAVNR
ncbi:MAG: hypothetical protein ACOCUH_01960 [Bacteriovoracia bacterium]